MTTQFAIRHEIAELLGPLRCQRCASSNAECFVKARSERCFQCQSDCSQCLFTRTVKRSGGAHIFSWEELAGEKEPSKHLEGNEDSPQSSQGPTGREDGPISQIGHRSRQEIDPWTPQLYPRAQSPIQCNIPYTAEFPLPQASSNTWLPLSATSRRRYSSPAGNTSSETIPRQGQSRTANTRAADSSMLESPFRQDQKPMDVHPVTTTSLMPPPGPLPSIRDSLSNIDPRIISPRPGTIRTWPLASPNSSISTMFTTDDYERSERAQSSVPSEASEPRSHDFVLETFNTASRSMESRRGKRRGKLSESSASSASRLRSIGACWKCKLQKNQASLISRSLRLLAKKEQCSTDDPCGPCRKLLEAKKYCPPCFRGSFVDLVPRLFWGE